MRRIVVRGTNWVGDTVMSIPALKALRGIFPHAWMAVWAKTGLAPIIRSTGLSSEIISFDDNHGGPLVRPFRMRYDLNRGKFQMAVLFQNAFESAFTSWLAGIPIRAGYPTDLRWPFLNLRVPLTAEIKQQHQVFYYVAIIEHLAKRIPGKYDFSEPDCSIPITSESLERVRNLLAENGLNSGRPFICLCPGSVNSEAKRWPADYFAKLADLLIRQGTAAVFMGAPEERELIDVIMGMMHGTALNLAAKTDMIDSMALMNLSDMVISNDTGSAHLAVAASARVLTIFGPTVPGATAPFGKRAHIIQGSAHCAPCKKFRCPLPDHPCMRSIMPEVVLEKADKILKTPEDKRPF